MKSICGPCGWKSFGPLASWYMVSDLVLKLGTSRCPSNIVSDGGSWFATVASNISGRGSFQELQT